MSGISREKVELLVVRATSPTDEDDEEARTAAMKACQILRKYPELLATPAASERQGPTPPAKPNRPPQVHPDAELLRQWRAMMREKKLTNVRAPFESICADCGKIIEVHSNVVFRKDSDLMTHEACRAWWWNFEAPCDETDNEIPF